MKDIINYFLRDYYFYDKKNTDDLLLFIKKFAIQIADKMGIKQKIKIQWKYNQNLFIFGSFDKKTKTIFFNINRIIALKKYRIKSRTKDFAMFVEKFISNFNPNSETDIAEKSLYFTFTNKSKEILCFLGDYEQVPFDIVTTILHELRHLYQIEQAELGDQFFLYITKNDIRSLQKDFNPLCEPTEIDAIFFQLKVLREYCFLHNIKDVFAESYKLSVPKMAKSDIRSNIKFISENCKLYSSVENLSILESELKEIYNWQISN